MQDRKVGTTLAKTLQTLFMWIDAMVYNRVRARKYLVPETFNCSQNYVAIASY